MCTNGSQLRILAGETLRRTRRPPDPPASSPSLRTGTRFWSISTFDFVGFGRDSIWRIATRIRFDPSSIRVRGDGLVDEASQNVADALVALAGEREQRFGPACGQEQANLHDVVANSRRHARYRCITAEKRSHRIQFHRVAPANEAFP